MKKLAWLLIAVVVTVLGYTAAGPFLTIRAIDRAVTENRPIALTRRVDFPALRGSLKLQLNDYLVRQAGAGVQSSRLGQFGLRTSGVMLNTAIDASVNPAGLIAWMQGRRLYAYMIGQIVRHPDVDAGMAPAEVEPTVLQQARFRYESTSRFTATVTDDAGRSYVFVLTRNGVRWRLSDVRLPLGQQQV